jgi:hypothetical protein
MSKAKPVRLGGLLVLAAALAVVAGLSWGHLGAGSSHAGSTGTMVVDCDADTAGVQADCSFAPGATFHIQVLATPGSGGVFGWQAKTAWIDGVVNYVPAANPASEATWEDSGGSNLCGVPARTVNPDASVLFGCVPFPLPTSGVTSPGSLTFEFNCKSDFSGVSAGPGLDPNQSSIDLVPRANDSQLGSHFLDQNLSPIDPTLTGATVTCEDQPTPTATTPGGGGSPTPTPVEVCGSAGCTEFDDGDATIAVGESTVLTFRVEDLAGTAVEGVECTFSVASGGGSVDPTTDTSDANGHVTTTYTAGDTPETAQVMADCGDYGSSVLAVEVATVLPGTGLSDTEDNGLSTVAWAIAGALLAAAVAGLGFFGWRYARYDRRV